MLWSKFTVLYSQEQQINSDTSKLKMEQRDSLSLISDFVLTENYNVGAVSRINGVDLESFPSMGLGNALQGKLMGLIVRHDTGGTLGSNNATLISRGLSRGGGDGIITIVDGMERGIGTLLAEEVESIEILKDPLTKLIYGPRAANGVLLVTTKKGRKMTRTIHASLESGIGLAAKYPNFLQSYDYAKLYNEARTNDGLPGIYTDDDLLAYKNSSGENDFRYPNLDYYNYFLNNYNNFNKATFEYSGGTETTQYSFIGGFLNQTGLEKIGRAHDRNRFNARGNLSMRINDLISASIGMGLVFDVANGNQINDRDLISTLSSHRPNEYPIMIPENIIPADSAGYPNLGASNTVIDNLYGTLMYGGYRKNQSLAGQLNVGLDFDFKHYVKGLKASTYLMFDNEFSGTESLSTTAATYSQRWFKTPDGNDSLIMIMRKQHDKNDLITLTDNTNSRKLNFLGSLNYERNLNDHLHVSLQYLYNFYLNERTGINQDIKFLNNVLKVNFINRDKYIIQGNIGYLGNNKFSNSNRYAMSYAAALGWIISSEDFFQTVDYVDFLKLKSSFGVLPYDGQTAYNLFLSSYESSGSARMNNSLNPSLVKFYQIGNPSLKWEKSLEFNLGIEALAFNNKLNIELNYFNEMRSDIIQAADFSNSMVLGGLYQFVNWGQVQNRGIEAEILYTDKVGEFTYQLGVNTVYSKNKIIKTNQVDYPDDYLNRVGKPTDAMYGYVAMGLFGKDVDLSSAYQQTFGTYGIGDIAYEDLNQDQMINELDQQKLGNSFPRFNIGLNVNLMYKRFGLYVSGTSQLGFYNWLNNDYYWIRGENKYSELALERYHVTNNPTGHMPRLTTTNGSNNFRNSSFWIEKADFLKLKNVELSYTYQGRNTLVFKSMKFFIRGTNLLTLSHFADFDPEALDAGLTAYPILKNITGGIKVVF